jgi:hypothetical protein
MAEAAKPELRFEFVGMMFAVAAGEIGITAAELVETDLWSKGNVLYSLPAVSHLLLAAFVIAASWVGWSRSKASLTIRDVTDVVSRPFVVLMLDVLLVVVYIILVKTVEIEVNGDGGLAVEANARKESFWLLVTFGGYFLWDVVTKLGEAGFAARTSVSAICFGLAWIPWLVLHDLTHRWRVVVADCTWIVLLILFRAGKDLVTAIGPRTAGETEEDYRARSVTRRSAVAWVVALSALFALGLWLARSGPMPTWLPSQDRGSSAVQPTLGMNVLSRTVSPRAGLAPVPSSGPSRAWRPGLGPGASVSGIR